MKKELIFNTDLHFEHENWNRELLFWEDELTSFQNRLDELVLRWTAKEVLAEVKNFKTILLFTEKPLFPLKIKSNYTRRIWPIITKRMKTC